MEKKKAILKGAVKVRKKFLTDGRIKLFLDIYHDGQRHKEYLKLYLTKDDTPEGRQHNRDVLREADIIRAKRQTELSCGHSPGHAQGLDTPFLWYYRKLLDSYNNNINSNATWSSWRDCLRQLEEYCDEKTTFRDVTPDFVKGFKEFLDRVEKKNSKGRFPSGKLLSHNTKFLYFTKFRACINKAYADGILKVNPLSRVSGIPKKEVRREFLTMRELAVLSRTPCENPGLKRTFLFSCFTGMRKSDIIRLTWGDIYEVDGFTRVVYRQKKTRVLEHTDFNPQAVNCMGERTDGYKLVFPDFRYSTRTSVHLQEWCASAGIYKKITFHCARHTFAIMMLELGADIYTISKLLGHKNIKTTQIYVKVLDKMKRELVMRIPDIGSHPGQ